MAETIADQPAPDYLSADDVIRTLERAGETLMRLRIRGVYPDSYRAFWPEVIHGFDDRVGWLPDDVVPIARPSAADIALMDAVAPWPLYVLDIRKRRIVQARSLINPRHGKHMFSWRRIAEQAGVHHETIRDWHAFAIDQIVTAVNPGIDKPDK